MSEETQSLTGAVGLATKTGGWIKKEEVKKAVSSYENYHESFGGSDSARKSNYTDMVNKYYDLVTSFYEYGWGESFHFAHRMRGETLRESIKRHEHFLALRLGLGPGMKVLDVGCGIGGPLREIALFSGATVTGLNNNEYQISRGKVLNRRHRALEACGFIKADFMSIPVPDASFDAVYAIEATCHAPDAVGCYSEVKRVLKPGQCFAAYEWCLTDAYDPNNPQHQEVKREVELGNGLPDIRTTAQVRQALLDTGFELLEAADLTETAEVAWHMPLDPSYFSLSQFKLTRVGRFLTTTLVQVLERLRIAPAGSYRVQKFLERGADALVEGGNSSSLPPSSPTSSFLPSPPSSLLSPTLAIIHHFPKPYLCALLLECLVCRREIFTPMYFFLARKPL
ncbi:unnamed protein product [Closterium sp. Naga37s-1]|nr:unnamed protein product [Closterium sp. Naga37s-1]